MYKLPERGGGVIRAMPERKHFFLGGVPLAMDPILHICVRFSAALSTNIYMYQVMYVCQVLFLSCPV